MKSVVFAVVVLFFASAHGGLLGAPLLAPAPALSIGHAPLIAPAPILTHAPIALPAVAPAPLLTKVALPAIAPAPLKIW